LIAKIYDMNLAFDYPDPEENSYGVIWSLTDPALDLEKPAIAANDDSVVIATQVDNESVPTEKWLSLWYCPNHNGEVGDQDNLSISGVWSIENQEVVYPEVSHVTDDIFMCQFIIGTELFVTFSWDGGETWARNQSEGWMEYYSWSGDDTVINDYRSHDVSDDASMSIWEYDASSGGDVLIYLHYTFNTVELTGDCVDGDGQPVIPGFVRILNYDIGDVLEASIEGNTYTRTMILGLDLWTNLTLRIASIGQGKAGYVDHNFSTIDHVNVVDLVLDRRPGDTDGDGDVDISDLLTLLAGWGQMEHPGDVNFDGIVNISDLLLLLANWGS
jgi:hypothetical protein